MTMVQFVDEGVLVARKFTEHQKHCDHCLYQRKPGEQRRSLCSIGERIRQRYVELRNLPRVVLSDNWPWDA